MKIRKEVGYYEVKELLDLKIQDGKEYCLVWWCNFPKKQATWEPIDNINMISDWEICYKQLKDKKNAKKQENKGEFHSFEGNSRKIQLMKTKTQSQRQHMKRSQKVIKERSKVDRHVKLRNKLHQKQNPSQHLKLPQRISQSIYQSQIIQSINEQQSHYPQSQRIDKNKKPIKLKTHTKIIEKKNVKVVRYKGKRMELKPLSIDLQVTQPQNIPFEGLELERIKASFMKDGKILYEVQFKDDPIKEAIMINEKYLKLLWPRKLAEYLLSKMDNNNRKA